MFELINRDNGNFIGIKNKEICEIDLYNFRYDLTESDDFNKVNIELEHKLLPALMIMLKNKNIKMKLQYSGYWSIKYFLKNWYLRIKSKLINKYSQDRIFYHWVSQSDFLMNCQKYQAYHNGNIPIVYVGINSLKKSLNGAVLNYKIKAGDNADYLGVRTQVARFFTDGYMFGVDVSNNP